MDCRLPRREPADSLIIASMRHAPVSEAESFAAAQVRAGNPKAEIAMIDGRCVRLGELRPAVDVLLGCTATVEQRDAAAQVLILCQHRPWRVLAAEHMAGRKGLRLRGLA